MQNGRLRKYTELDLLTAMGELVAEILERKMDSEKTLVPEKNKKSEKWTPLYLYFKTKKGKKQKWKIKYHIRRNRFEGKPFIKKELKNGHWGWVVNEEPFFKFMNQL